MILFFRYLRRNFGKGSVRVQPSIQGLVSNLQGASVQRSKTSLLHREPTFPVPLTSDASSNTWIAFARLECVCFKVSPALKPFLLKKWTVNCQWTSLSAAVGWKDGSCSLLSTARRVMSQSGRAMQRKAICCAACLPVGRERSLPFPRSLPFRGSWEQRWAESLGREEADRGGPQRKRVVAGRVEVTLSHHVEAMAIRIFFLGTQNTKCFWPQSHRTF